MAMSTAASGVAHAAVVLVKGCTMLAPAGARLPPGVRLLAPVVVARAVPRGAVARRMAAAGDGALGDDEGAEGMFFKLMEAQGSSALDLLAEIVAPATLVIEAERLKADVSDAVALARMGRPGEEADCVKRMLRVSYRIARLAYDCYPAAGLAPLPKLEGFIALCRGTSLEEETEGKKALLGMDIFTVTGVGGESAEGIKAVMRGMTMATFAVRTSRYIFLGCCGGGGALPRA